MADDNLEYLRTGFDPLTLTVPRLRSILVTHDVDYPSGAKKPQLVQIFSDQVTPRAKKLLSIQDKARRSSRGITDADSQDGTVGGDEELMPPPPTPARRGRRTTTRVKSEDDESDVAPVRSPTKKTPRASKTGHPKASDTETGTDLDGGKKSVRRSRKSEMPTPIAPKVKQEEIDDGAGVTRTNRRESNFTYDNPFQSGSSPPPGLSSGERTRKSLESSSKDLTRRKSGTTRRRTDGPQVKESRSASSSFEIPVAALKDEDVDENGVKAGEEFTPEEQLELVQEVSTNGKNAIVPRQKKKARGVSKKYPLWATAITLFGGYAAWYRQEKVAVGYCGIGKPVTQIFPDSIDVHIPDSIKTILEPQCEICPQHAYCSADLDTHCEADFVLKPHPLSLFGAVPLPPTCEPDGEKARRVKAVADRAVEELRERRAKFECGELTDDAGHHNVPVEINAEELKKEVSKKRRKGMGEAEFEELWAGAIGEIEGRDEVVSGDDGLRKLLTSTSTARVPLGCAIRIASRQYLARHIGKIITLILTILGSFYARHEVISRKQNKAAIPQLVSYTLDLLKSQASLHAQDKEEYPENYISIGQLRDDVLRDEHSIRKREALWSMVKKVVEMNANVRSSQREDRNGEISRVWEWIGAVGAIEGGRRKSGRVSWGAYGEASSPVSGSDAGPEVVQQKWQEGRPIY